jgi:hypothetical protein
MAVEGVNRDSFSFALENEKEKRSKKMIKNEIFRYFFIFPFLVQYGWF